MSASKSVVTFACDLEILKRFRKIVIEKHGKLYGVLQEEFETALLNYITEYTDTEEGDC